MNSVPEKFYIIYKGRIAVLLPKSQNEVDELKQKKHETLKKKSVYAVQSN